MKGLGEECRTNHTIPPTTKPSPEQGSQNGDNISFKKDTILFCKLAVGSYNCPHISTIQIIA